MQKRTFTIRITRKGIEGSTSRTFTAESFMLLYAGGGISCVPGEIVTAIRKEDSTLFHIEQGRIIDRDLDVIGIASIFPSKSIFDIDESVTEFTIE